MLEQRTAREDQHRRTDDHFQGKTFAPAIHVHTKEAKEVGALSALWCQRNESAIKTTIQEATHSIQGCKIQ